MQPYETQIEIDATPENVWETLTQDMPRDPAPYGIVRFEGAIRAGAKIKLWSEVVPNRAFSLTVARLEANKVMVWRGGMPFGLFVGTRTFTLAPSATGCTFQMREVFSGPLSRMITKSMSDLTPSFIKFANTLKQEAEKK